MKSQCIRCFQLQKLTLLWTFITWRQDCTSSMGQHLITVLERECIRILYLTVFSFCIHSGSCTLAWWWWWQWWPVLQVKISCQIIKIHKRGSRVWLKTSLYIWILTLKGKLHIKKIKTTWKRKICKFLTYYILLTFQCAQSSAHFSGGFRLMEFNHAKLFDVIVSTKSVFLKFHFVGEGKWRRGGECRAESTTPCVRQWLTYNNTRHHISELNEKSPLVSSQPLSNQNVMFCWLCILA
jgi:hypothetical protein